jgi:NAD(P)-dependent dehydrogenase (short-subunit alcohol dehydrogenase family)
MVADGFLDLGALQALDGADSVKDLLGRTQEALAGGVRWMFAVTGLGGRLGRDGLANGNLIGAGVAGFVKSLAKERPDLRIGVIDVCASADPEQIASDIIAEIASRHPQVEVGYDGGSRLGLRPMPAPLPESSAPRLPLGGDSVVLVTGGARGITAAAAVELARRARCHLVLVGRSPLPAPEPPGYAQASDLAGLRRLLIEEGRLHEPRAIESECRRIMAAREVRATLEAIQAAGATCEYHALDVRDTAAFAELIEQLYRRHGCLDLVVHGAGIIEDKWLKDKDRASFDRVFDTKVGPARLLAERLRDDVKAVVLFSSVAGAFGNRGQCDYAAAGDTLDKLAWSLQQRLPGRVVAIDWGPWSGAGMVSDELAREYGRRGIGLIDLREGIESFIREISTSDARDPQVVLMAGEPDAFEPAGSRP